MEHSTSLEEILGMFERHLEQALSCVSEPQDLAHAMVDLEQLVSKYWSIFQEAEPSVVAPFKDRIEAVLSQLARLQRHVDARLEWVNELNRSLAERVDKSP